MKLFCFSYAGGSSLVFHKWEKLLQPGIQLRTVDLPGHGVKFRRPLLHTFEEAVDHLYHEIMPEADGPYALYGHSLGALFAYEVARKFQAAGQRPPTHLFVSGKKAPQCKPEIEIAHDLPDAEFQEAILGIGGTAQSLFEDAELATLFLPLMRADMELVNSYQYQELRQPLSCDMTVLYGIHDAMTTDDHDEWQVQAGGGYRVCWLEGGHFFPFENMESTVRVLNETLLGTGVCE